LRSFARGKKIILKKISFFRFREQDAEDTWRQVALTISVMPVNERMIKKLNECAFMFQDKVSDLEIRDNLLEVCNNAKIFQKLTKEIDELEQVICGDKTLPIPATPKKSQRPREAGTAKKKKVSAKRNNAIWSSDEEEDSMPGTRIMKVPVSFYLKFSDTVSTESTVPSRSSRRLRS
jgi:hypothetical protein